jgi:sterol desaturase/sphingolipid hydroxylase (fatty acid hydroxylase superfamily)
MFFLPTLLLLVGTYSALLALVLSARAVERIRPVEREQSRAHLVLDWKLAAVNIGLNSLFAPAAKASGAFIVNWAGGGWIALRADGWWFLPSFALVLLANDLFAYLWHRAQHKIPVLWAMHSLHHSAEALNIVTGARHFWLETVITTAFLPVLAILFRIPHAIVVAVVAAALFAGRRLASELAAVVRALRAPRQQSAIPPHPPFPRAAAPEQEFLQGAAALRHALRHRVAAGA